MRIFVHGAKKQQSLCAAALDTQKCLQNSLKLYKSDVSVTQCNRQRVPETRSSDGKTPVSETRSCSSCGTRPDISRSQKIGMYVCMYVQMRTKHRG